MIHKKGSCYIAKTAVATLPLVNRRVRSAFCPPCRRVSSSSNTFSLPERNKSTGTGQQVKEMSSFRIETDTMGAVEVEDCRLWGAQTQRSIDNFKIYTEGCKYSWGRSMIKGMGVLKKSAALANKDLSQIAPDIADLIVRAADEVIAGKWDDEFPLVVFQTGSGTQSNMNCNEVISNRAIEMADGVKGSKIPVNPNDHVNRGQSSNDTFPTAMHICTVDVLSNVLIPAILELRETLHAKEVAYNDVVKIGRTHLQDATPITLGQEISSWVCQIDHAIGCVRRTIPGLLELAIGGTAVGTGTTSR